MLLASVCAQGVDDPACLFNATHCACRQNTAPGNCLRKDSTASSDATCTVATCNAGGYACDCLGDNICKIDTCSIWVPKDGTIASRLAKDSTVPCMQKKDGTCLSKVELPVDYKMVQFGSATRHNVAGTMFNISLMPDAGDKITSSYKMSDAWDHPETLRYRHITMRMYQRTSGEPFLCAVYNTYGVPSDGLGLMKVTVTITGLAGQALSWVACDDKKECTGGPSSTLQATHSLVFTHSDGWCVMPVSAHGEGISVKFDNVNGFEGVTFQLSDAAEDVFYFRGDQDKGMTGTIDDNGLVSNGAVPEIVFNLAGIQVPQ